MAGRILKVQWTAYRKKEYGSSEVVPVDFEYAVGGKVNGGKMIIYAITSEYVHDDLHVYIKVRSPRKDVNGNYEYAEWFSGVNLHNLRMQHDCKAIMDEVD